MHVGSNSLTRDGTWVPCIASVESYPLHHQRSPLLYLLILYSRSVSSILKIYILAPINGSNGLLAELLRVRQRHTG